MSKETDKNSEDNFPEGEKATLAQRSSLCPNLSCRKAAAEDIVPIIRKAKKRKASNTRDIFKKRCALFPFPEILTISLCLKTHHQNRSSHHSCCVPCVSHSVVYDSLWPHGLQPIRLLCPRDFPGKNTGVGCHSFSSGQFVRTVYSDPSILGGPAGHGS